MILCEAGYDQTKHETALNKIRKEKNGIKAIVEAVAQMYVELYSLSGPEDINNGMCEDFAYDVKNVLPKAKVTWLEQNCNAETKRRRRGRTGRTGSTTSSSARSSKKRSLPV